MSFKVGDLLVTTELVILYPSSKCDLYECCEGCSEEYTSCINLAVDCGPKGCAEASYKCRKANISLPAVYLDSKIMYSEDDKLVGIDYKVLVEGEVISFFTNYKVEKVKE